MTLNPLPHSVMVLAMLLTGLPVRGTGASAGTFPVASQAINALGLDLLRRDPLADGNTLLSPYSIQAALAMTYAGAANETRTEMARVLHYPLNDEAALHQSFTALAAQLEAMAQKTLERSKQLKEQGMENDPVVWTMANRLFGQLDYAFRDAFLQLTRDHYGAPLQPMDFRTAYEPARLEINRWVGEQTRERIRDLIPAGGLDKETRMVLVNAVYLKAPWLEPFAERLTQSEPFHVSDGATPGVPTMRRTDDFGYLQGDGYRVVTLPYFGGDLQFVVVLPDVTNGLAAVERTLTAETLTSWVRLRPVKVDLHLPKFKLEPPLMRLGPVLKSLGMESAFDQPRGSADFDRMAPRRPDDYLFISEVFHKTFLDLDEKGTEAAAATAVVMARATAFVPDPPKPVEVKVDRPFLFAIQQRSTGACLFIGRVVDPR